MFGIQLQRYQRRKDDEFYERAKLFVDIVRNANPKIPIILQVSIAPPVWKGENIVRNEKGEKLLLTMKAEEVLEKLELIKPLADGFAILYTEKSFDEMKRLILLLRQ
jgi:hypothetical protein